MHAPVLVEAGALGERLVALGAGEGPQARVHQHVAAQVPGRHEGFVAALAFVGPLSGVNALVHGQVGRLPEPLGTLIAGIRLVAQVGSLVAPETGRVRKHLAALRAEERLLAGVRAEMGLVGGELGEAFATLLALVGFALGVDALVAGQGGRAGEGFAAVGAQVGLFSGVGALVVFQVLQLRVRFPALVTRVRPVALVVPSVFPKHRRIRKTLTALGTEVWLFSRVRARVHLQLGQGGVALGALAAGERALSTVLRHVDPQADGLHEGLSALRAYEGFLPGVGAAVVAELRGCLVSLVTVGTLEGPLSGVSALVL